MEIVPSVPASHEAGAVCYMPVHSLCKPYINACDVRFAELPFVNESAFAMLSMSTSAKVKTPSRVCTVDITDSVRCAVRDAGVAGSGQVSVLPMHTSCAVTVNENEPRLADDIRQLLASLAPAGAAYLHDDIWLREAPPGHDPEEWRSHEPVNADSHLRAMLLGASETLPLEHGDLALGTWQSVLLVELDGPNNRSVKLNVMGSTSPESG